MLTSDHYAYFLSSNKEKDVARGTTSCFEKVFKKLYTFWLISIKYLVPRLWLVRKGAKKCRFYFRLSMYSQKINGSHSAEMLEKAGLPWAACRCPLPSDFRLPLEPHLAVVSSKASSSPSDTSLHLSFPQIVLSQHHHVFNLLLWPRILYSLSSTHFLFM